MTIYIPISFLSFLCSVYMIGQVCWIPLWLLPLLYLAIQLKQAKVHKEYLEGVGGGGGHRTS